jgi:hypothetical protein
VQLSDSKSAYAQELLQVLAQQTRLQRDILAKIVKQSNSVTGPEMVFSR